MLFVPFQTFFWCVNCTKYGLLIMHYVLEVSRYRNIVYIGVHLALIYIQRLFSPVCYFLSYYCWSVNYMSRVSKFHSFFLTCSETEAIFEGFQYCHLWKVQFQLFSTFFRFFSSGLQIAQVTFLDHFCRSVNCMS